MSDEIMEETPEVSLPTPDEVPDPDRDAAEPLLPASSGTEAAEAERDPNAPPRRRRRRGSRGGRNRRKPAADGTTTADDDDAVDDDGVAGDEIADGPAGDDHHDANADRGLTTEDVAADAFEDAGLSASTTETGVPRVGDSRPAPPGRPQIGDSRPAPAAASGSEPAAEAGAAKPGSSRRRRRGGRGRNRSGRGEGGTTNGAPKEGAPKNGTQKRAGANGGGRDDGDVILADLGVGPGDPLLELDDDVLERRRGRTRKGRPAGRYLMCVHVHRDSGTTHIAVLEGRNLVEHNVGTLEDDDTSIDGNIYLGKVQNVLPGMEAAFVDIGTPKNGVLYRGDVAFDSADVDEAHPKIERLLKNGQSVLVQVTKNPIGAKGARLTQEVSLAGRFVVMVPGQPDTYGISKRLPDDERKRLRRVLEGLRPPDAGLIVRTAAEGATPEELELDVRRLRSQWEQISGLAARSKPARLIYQEPPLVVRVIREEFTKEYRGIVIDDPELYEQVKGYVEAIAPELAERIEFYDEAEEGLPLYERFHVQEQLLKALDRKVWLPSGGSLIIERTEALTVIDVNTGKNVGKTNLEETVFRNNLEAADEIARQLRLRDIGGIIVIDFIDMEIRKNRDEVMRGFRDALARDKTRTQAFEISELGLVEMTRKRISEGLVESFSMTCPTCNGRGIMLDEAQIAGIE
jgi:ribonuclease E